MIPTDATAYRLMHHGMLAFADMEEHGFVIDTKYIDEATIKLEDEVAWFREQLTGTRLWTTWVDTYGAQANLLSPTQLGVVLFDKLEYTPTRYTAAGGRASDTEALEGIDEPGIDSLIAVKQRTKAVSTYLNGIRKLVVNGRVHPSYNLHTTVTYRSSASDPNLQNVPIRNPEIGPIVRRAFIAPEGMQIGEIDLSGAEVRVGACYHKDPKMIEYIHDPSTDMHRDAAADIFKMEQSQVSKDIRSSVKGDWVFAQFYGSYFKQCAVALWRRALKNLTTDGVMVKDHLATQGILDYESFESHCARAEDIFWNERFKGYTKWKEQRWQVYQTRGYFDTLTGFRCSGRMTRNAATNYPIQGTAFHVDLRLLIDLNRWLRKHKFRTCIVGQVHDSIILYIEPSELADVLAYVKQWFIKLPSSWPWVCVPLDYEVEIAPVGGSWADKRKISNG